MRNESSQHSNLSSKKKLRLLMRSITRSYRRLNGNDVGSVEFADVVPQSMSDQITMMSELVDAVEEDTSLHSVEKETTMSFSKVDDRVSVYSEEAGLMRRLLRHPHFEVESLRGTDGQQIAPNDFEEESITGVKGSLPITALVLQTSLRATSQHSAVVPEGVLRL
ncbi:hypothetical protein [Halobellus rubicundus]|uniref:Uncharacterized protein n=1 Tax=Halobellus rubicundus TaxID=2996466 RepID=A0ABD5MEW2_9EURY